MRFQRENIKFHTWQCELKTTRQSLKQCGHQTDKTNAKQKANMDFKIFFEVKFFDKVASRKKVADKVKFCLHKSQVFCNFFQFHFCFRVNKSIMIKFAINFVILSVLQIYAETSSSEVSCESIIDFSWGYAGKHKTCDMDGTTKIDTFGFVMASSKDESIAAIQLARNKKIFFLPEKVNEKFPNLVLYSANECSIKEISKVNFKGMKLLKSLYLYHNFIEKIPSDTFEDLNSLKELELRKIFFLNFLI